jgi:hypothetical protein
MMTLRERQLALADRIAFEIKCGVRHYTLGGAELDWVIEAIRRAYGEQRSSRKSRKSSGGQS